MITRRSRKPQEESSAPMISLQRVSRFYKADRPAIFDLTLNIDAGEFIYIAGASGAGKSTLLRLLHLDESPDTGKIFFSGHDITLLQGSAICVLRRSMGVVYQDFKLIEDMTVAANIGLPLEVLGLSRRAIGARVKEVLGQIDLSGCENEMTGDLSGGEQQRVAIARSLVGKPKLILADEPTGSLDTYSANLVLDVLEAASNAGATVLLATHDRLLMAARPHRTAALEGGRLVGMSSEGAFKSRAMPGKKKETVNKTA